MSLDERDLARQNGLSDQEFDAITSILGRAPNLTEIGIFSAMWSEHCSYRSSKPFLKKMFSQGAQVIEGPGENAGVVDIGDGLAAVFKMESHNHPSFIEPFQGAATGMGGIMRDVFTMGARPVAFLDALRFGAPDHPKTRHLVEGVVAGIGSYGNCVGVPTVGGELDFDPSYNGNILVNAMCVGLVRTDQIFRSRVEPGCRLIYVGARTGRDGIHGAMMASASFEGDEASRTSVQIGDPFMQKLLLEACLEMMQTSAIIGLQDMGAAGLTSASVEMAEKSGAGITLNLDLVPCRQDNMSAYEIMLSESQERMLIACRPEAEDVLRAICDKWDIACITIGEANKSQKLTLNHRGRMEAEIPIEDLVHGAPPLARKVKPLQRLPRCAAEAFAPQPLDEALMRLMSSPDLCARSWVWQQYDHTVMGDTLSGPGGDAALVRVHGTRKALALTTEITPRYCEADAYEGAKQAVAESFRNIIATGARPLAITDCLNFASPENAVIMGQFAAAIEGINEAARALDMPVVSGNVSFYNESEECAIIPTPAIGGLGLIEDYEKTASMLVEVEGAAIVLIGETRGEMGAGLYAKHFCPQIKAAPPPTDLLTERRNGLFVLEEINNGSLIAVHDLGTGGLGAAAAEMALASDMGLKLGEIALPCAPHIFFFAEDQARFLAACAQEDLAALEARALKAGVPMMRLGISGGKELIFPDMKISLDVLRCAHEHFLPQLMASGE